MKPLHIIVLLLTLGFKTLAQGTPVIPAEQEPDKEWLSLQTEYLGKKRKYQDLINAELNNKLAAFHNTYDEVNVYTEGFQTCMDYQTEAIKYLDDNNLLVLAQELDELYSKVYNEVNPDANADYIRKLRSRFQENYIAFEAALIEQKKEELENNEPRELRIALPEVDFLESDENGGYIIDIEPKTDIKNEKVEPHSEDLIVTINNKQINLAEYEFKMLGVFVFDFLEYNTFMGSGSSRRPHVGCDHHEEFFFRFGLFPKNRNEDIISDILTLDMNSLLESRNYKSDRLEYPSLGKTLIYTNFETYHKKAKETNNYSEYLKVHTYGGYSYRRINSPFGRQFHHLIKFMEPNKKFTNDVEVICDSMFNLIDKKNHILKAGIYNNFNWDEWKKIFIQERFPYDKDLTKLVPGAHYEDMTPIYKNYLEQFENNSDFAQKRMEEETNSLIKLINSGHMSSVKGFNNVYIDLSIEHKVRKVAQHLLVSIYIDSMYD